MLAEPVTSNQSALNQSSLVLQYAAMFVSAGEAGDAKKVQTSVAAARKVFRIFRVSCSVDIFEWYTISRAASADVEAA